MIEKIKKDWFSNIRGDILSGMVVALALIPEAIAFSIIAGVDPMVGLYASFCIAVIISFVGGRPAMISAATGAMALLMLPLVKEHGLNYLLAATILTGIIQILFGVLKIARLMKFIPRAVMIGFVNSLAILVFMAQMPHLKGASVATFLFVGITILILVVVPRFWKVIPAPLIAVVVLTAVAMFVDFDLKTVGDLGTISQTLPQFFIPDVPLTWETLTIIFPYSIALAIVGLLESLLTASVLDDLTDTESDKNKEARGQGIANVINGFFGGMAGCAMIGQSVINVKSGGRGRLSTFVAGFFLMFLIIVLGDLVVQIPMAILVGIMIMVCVGQFDWSSFAYLRKAPKSDAFVLIVTVTVVLVTHDLSKGVIAGVMVSAVLFVAKISQIQVKRDETADNLNYIVKGQLFFASVEGFMQSFDFNPTKKRIYIDFSNAHIWDDSAVGAIDKVMWKFQESGMDAIIIGLNASSKKMLDQLARYHEKSV
ncbi:MAG: SulP family inorganic anion transporter [Bacillus sp. (in: firmicutes)]